MNREESLEEYQDRMNKLFDRINNSIEGEDLDELVLVFTRLTILALDQMQPKRRKAMLHVLKEYIDLGTIQMEDTTLN